MTDRSHVGPVGIYLRFCAMHIRSVIQFKASFALTVIGHFLTSFATFIGMYFLFNRFGNIDGYSFSEVLICYSTILFSFSCAETFFRGFDSFSTIISNGEFDRAMVRPRSPMYLVLCSRLEVARFGRFLQAIVILAYAIPTSGVEWTPVKLLTLLLMCVCGTLLFAGLFIIYAGICFFTTEGLEFMNIFTDGGRELGKYPLDVYGPRYLRFFTFIVPIACVQYYPFTYIIGRSDDILRTLTPLVAILFLIPALVIWRLGLRHYKSTGS